MHRGPVFYEKHNISTCDCDFLDVSDLLEKIHIISKSNILTGSASLQVQALERGPEGERAAHVHAFSQKSITSTVHKEFPIGLYDLAETDLKHFWDNRSEELSGHQLYVRQYVATTYVAATTVDKE